ncbi:MAG: peptidase domain-containing ABC transporter [Mogibacterium sp.]|nr:peptidase domain-containing ABC transporter [Mogibacterium sp.]
MKYKHVKQHDMTDCAAACLAMICLYYKKETTITRLRDMMGTDLKGTNLIGLSKCAEKLGFENASVRVDKEGFQSKFTLPCIANVITKEGLSHFVVVYKIGKDKVIVGDPGKESTERQNIDDFLKRFTGALLILRPTDEFKTGKIEGEGTYRRFVKLLLPQKKLFIFAILASLMMTVLGIVSSLFNKIIMDEVLPYGLEKLLLSTLIIFTIVGFTQILIEFLRSWIMLYLSQRIDIPLMLGYFKHIYSLPMRFFATRKTGDIITRFSDAFTIKDIFTNIALTLIMDVSMAAITGVILFRMNGKLFAIIALLTLLSIVLVFIFRQPYKKINQEQMQQASILNSQIIEGLEAVEMIKGNAVEERELYGIEREYIRSLRIAFKEGWLSIIQGSISSVISTIGNLFIMYFGIKQVLTGNISIGALMAFMTLSGYFMEPVGNLVGLQLDIQEAQISMKRITEILDYDKEEPETDEETERECNLKGDIKLDNISFRYGNRNLALENVSFTIEKGKKTALVGASGSGKSTIVKLLLKYYEAESGRIRIGGKDIAEVSAKYLRENISLVPQNIQLFSKSIYENVAMVKPEATQKEVAKALAMADAQDFIRKQPMQAYTYLEEAGQGLSGGERQRLALARAFLKDADLFILDESTSNLDFGTENVIFDTIYNKLSDKTMIIVAHRLSTIKNCDRIIVLEDGKVIEQGTHNELISTQGRYYELWQLQQGIKTADDAEYTGKHSMKEEAEQTESEIKPDDIITYT